METPIACACCNTPMQTFRCQHKVDGEVALDLCFGCQSIWFDQFESLQMAPSGILELFRLIHEHNTTPRHVWGSTLKCPRCEDRLVQSFDLCKNGKFTYYRCTQQHGRFTAFSALMVEKGFVRQLTVQEIEALAKQVQVVRCSSCGAPVDIRTQSACGYCHAPITILDPNAVEKALGQLVEGAKPPKPLDPNIVADMLLDHARQKWGAQLTLAKTGQWSSLDDNPVDLVTSGLAAIRALLKR
jgi:uncharacterized paraquat-inducible protein A